MVHHKIYINGKVLTGSFFPPHSTAFAVCHDRIAAVGSDRDIMKFSSEVSKVIDLHGKTVLPGFIESHNHLSVYAMNMLQLDCSCPANETITDIKRIIKKKADEVQPGEWILGFGYDDTLVAEKRHLTREDLDEIAPDNPVQILHVTVHFSYVNTLALHIAGIDKSTPQPEGGEIRKDRYGIPTGLLVEPKAMNLVRDHIPTYSVIQLKSVIRKAIRHFHQFGITSIHDGGIGYFRHGPEIIKAYQELNTEGFLSLRVHLTIIEEFYRSLFTVGIRSGFGSDFLKLGSVKLWQDGSIQGYTGALKQAYFNKSDWRGELLIPQETLNHLVSLYHAENYQIAIHANGDWAIESVLEAFEKAYDLCPQNNRRHMIIHCQMASDDQLKRMKHLGIIPNFFINHVYYWGDRHQEIFLGPDRAERIDPLASSLKFAVPFCLHSDLPVTPVDPISSIHTAVNRLTKKGTILGANERIPVTQAIKAYTLDAAYASFSEEKSGSIEPGKLADFILLSENPLEVSSDRIKDIQVLETVVGGRSVYSTNEHSL